MGIKSGKRRYALYYNMGQQSCRGQCGKWLPYDLTTLDHIIPRSRGGGNSYMNLQIMCAPCNQLKADKIDVCR